MSISAMTWAFSLPLEPRAKLALLAIADNARDDGIAWPSRDKIAEKSSQSRSTVSRRLKMLAALGVIKLKERFREDGTQTTDEIHLDLSLTPEQVKRKMHDSGETNGAETEDETAADATDGVGCQADTLPVQSGHPGVSQLTTGGVQSGHPQDEPSLEPKEDSPPTPSGGPLSKSDREASEKRDALWQRFIAEYPGIAAMDQQAAKAEFNTLPIDDAEWAVSVVGLLKAELAKLRDRPPKNAHLWLRKRLFTNFPRQPLNAPPPKSVWITEGSDEDLALRFVRGLCKMPHPFVRKHPSGSGPPGYPHPQPVGLDLLALLVFADQSPFRWPSIEPGTAEFAKWRQHIFEWVGGELKAWRIGETLIRVPCRWVPSKQGVIYDDDDGDICRAAS